MDTKNMLRLGTVSSLNPAACTARVTFGALDDLVTAELPVLNRGSQNDKDYWLPDVGEQVLCAFLPNESGRGTGEGFVLGSFFSSTDAPNASSADVRRITLSDGSQITHNRATGALDIYTAGDINITAKGTITINGTAVYIN